MEKLKHLAEWLTHSKISRNKNYHYFYNWHYLFFETLVGGKTKGEMYITWIWLLSSWLSTFNTLINTHLNFSVLNPNMVNISG